MKTLAWFFASIFLWLLVSTAVCGSTVCTPYIAVIYGPFWIPILVCAAVGEWASREFAGRWAAVCFVGLMTACTIVLLIVLAVFFPSLFKETTVFDNLLVLIMPTAAITVLYLVKIVRWTPN
jgi:O-antigen ligase